MCGSGEAQDGGGFGCFRRRRAVCVSPMRSRCTSASIGMANTRETYAAALDRLVADFGVDTNVALMPSCSAKYSTSSSGTSNGSGRNMPRWRTVTICTAKPSRL